MIKASHNEILVYAYSHIIDVSVENSYEENKEKVKDYILADPTGKRLFKNLSYNTYCFLTDPYGYTDETTFKNEDFYLLYVLGIINEVMHINPDYEEMIAACTRKDKILPYLKLQTGIKGLIDLYGVIDYQSLLEKLRYTFDSELFEIEVIDVNKEMFEEKTAPLLAAYCYEEDGYYVRREITCGLQEFLKAQQKECTSCAYADFDSEYILHFSSDFRPLNLDVEFGVTKSISEYFYGRQFSLNMEINPDELEILDGDLEALKLYNANYPKWLIKGHTPNDINSFKFFEAVGY